VRVLAGHIGDAPYLPLAPQELVVVEGRHLVEMNGVDRHHSTLPKTGKRIDDDLAAGANVIALSNATGGRSSSRQPMSH
jgi:hypothetical protein